ncbi:DUF3027 domain-containing protein [Agrococcus sp. Ld7]|uniref:DUF3027 domain-containing protein n=1 Tax=Agrococcus sp. Ld7 TaxID=649148 RepID=UPI003864DFC6
MTSTPESESAEPQEAVVHEHRIPEPEAGEAELAESSGEQPSTRQPLDHAAHGGQSSTQEPLDRAAAHAEQPAPEATTPTMRELELALAALDEIAPAGAVGEVQDALAEGGAHGQAQVVAIRHASLLAGYPDWSWTVLLSRGVEGGPSVLEVALLPGETSLLAPAWVPWTDRLADYLAAKDADDEADDTELDPELESDLESDLEDDFDDDFIEDDDDEDIEDDEDDSRS